MWSIRYRKGTDLARRFPTLFHPVLFATRDQAEEIRTACVNAADMETYEVEP